MPDAQFRSHRLQNECIMHVYCRYRDAGAEVIDVLAQRSDCVERASVDEAFIDLTTEVEKRLTDGFIVTPDHLPNTVVAGLDNKTSTDESKGTTFSLCRETIPIKLLNLSLIV